jgi:hypothetical protein
MKFTKTALFSTLQGTLKVNTIYEESETSTTTEM